MLNSVIAALLPTLLLAQDPATTDNVTVPSPFTAPSYIAIPGTQFCNRCGPILFNSTALSGVVFSPKAQPTDFLGMVPVCEVAKITCSCVNPFHPVQLLTDVNGILLDMGMGRVQKSAYCGLNGRWYVIFGTEPVPINTLMCYVYNPTPQPFQFPQFPTGC